jgi:uncharacterized protein DUF4190
MTSESGEPPTAPQVPATGYAAPPPGPPVQPYGPYTYVPARPTNGLAIASLVVSIASFVVCPLFAVVGVVLGYKARTQIRERGDDGDGLALAGIITGWCGVAFSVLYLAIIAVVFTIPFWGSTG